MYIVEVLENNTFSEFALAGKFARLERAQGAMEMLKRLGESRAMRVELVNPGLQGNKGRTEHGAALEMAKGAVEAVVAAKKKGRPKGSKNKPKVAPTPVAPKFVPPIQREDPNGNKEKVDQVTLTQEQVAAFVGAIKPGKPGSGEYVLDLGKFLVKAG